MAPVKIVTLPILVSLCVKIYPTSPTHTHTHPHTPTHPHTHTHTHIHTHTQSGTGEIKLVTGNTIKLSTDEKYYDCGDENTIFVDYKNIIKVIVPGDLIYVDDGLISLKVTSKGANWVMTGAYTLC